jgi:NAD(P)-dependent dehydrogenase (short-subunit alcohol dehydrogenase family)
MSSALTGNVALVTGAAGGIGTAIVWTFRSAGARVLALDVKAEALAAAFGGMGHESGRAPSAQGGRGRTRSFA